jgi:hypothetical protein
VATGGSTGLEDLRPQATAATWRELHVGDHPCEHYLLSRDNQGNLIDNRFAWWDIWERVAAGAVPQAETGAFTATTQEPEEVFLCELSPILATVIGAEVPTPAMVAMGLPYRTISWDRLADGDSPNTAAGTGFTVLSQPGAVVPVIREIQVKGIAAEALPRKALVGDAEAALGLLFDTPQRAVGLEFGCLADPNREEPLPASGVELVAFDRDGVELVRVRGAGPELDANIQPRFVNNRIGLRHRGGRISRVALSFTHYRGGDPIRLPPIVYRVWVEPLPHAAVRQDSVELRSDRLGDIQQGDVTVALPFRCDRAVAMVRGIRVQLPTGADHLRLVDVGIQAEPVTLRDPDVEDRHAIKLQPVGLIWGRGPAPYLVRVYYTLLAWDSGQAQLFAGRASRTVHITGGEDVEGDVEFRLEGVDPCPVRSRRGEPGGTIEDFCGPVFAALQRIRFDFRTGIDDINDFSFRSNRAGRPGLVDGEVAVAWPIIGTVTSAEGLGSDLHVDAVFLSGRSLRRGPDFREQEAGHSFTVSNRGPRKAGEYYWDERDTRFVFPIRLEEDHGVAFLTLSNLMFKPEGPVGELDVEALGSGYDGAVLDWKLGGGASTAELIEGGAGGGPLDRTFIMAWPDSCAIVPDRLFARPRLVLQDVLFDGVAGTLSLAPTRFGALRNDGDAPLLVARIVQQGDHPDAFDFRLVQVPGRYPLDRDPSLGVPGEPFAISDLLRRPPLQLLPGETLLVGGRFFPQAEMEHRAYLIFSTNDPSRSRVSISAVGAVAPSQAAGHVLPAQINFGLVPIGQARTRNVLLESTGSSPLILRRILAGRGPFDRPRPLRDTTFQIFGPNNAWPPPPNTTTYQLEPADSFLVPVTCTPPRPGPYEGRVVFETNAGDFEVLLFGDGVG